MKNSAHASNPATLSAIALPRVKAKARKRIADAWDSLETKTDAAERKTAQLQDLFRILLHELMTARTCVYELKIQIFLTA